VLGLAIVLGALALSFAWVSQAGASGGGRPDIHVNDIETVNFPDDGSLAAFHVDVHNDGGLSGPFYVKLFLNAGSPARIVGVNVEQFPDHTTQVSCTQLTSIAARCDVSGLAANSGDIVFHVDVVSTDVRGGTTRGMFAAASFGPYNDKDDTNNEEHKKFFVFEDLG
jgi:hypothetical protein